MSSGKMNPMKISPERVKEEESLKRDESFAGVGEDESSAPKSTKEKESIEENDRSNDGAVLSAKDEELSKIEEMELIEKKSCYDNAAVPSSKDGGPEKTTEKESTKNAAHSKDDAVLSMNDKKLSKAEEDKPTEEIDRPSDASISDSEDSGMSKKKESREKNDCSDDDYGQVKTKESTKKTGYSDGGGGVSPEDDRPAMTKEKKPPKKTDRSSDQDVLSSEEDKKSSSKTKEKESMQKKAQGDSNAILTTESNTGIKRNLKSLSTDERSERKRKREKLRRSEFNQALDLLASTLHAIDPTSNEGVSNDPEIMASLASYLDSDESKINDESKIKISNRVELINCAVSILRKNYEENENKKMLLANLIDRQTQRRDLLSHLHHSQNPLMRSSATIANPLLDTARERDQKNREEMLERLRTEGGLDNLGSLARPGAGNLVSSGMLRGLLSGNIPASRASLPQFSQLSTRPDSAQSSGAQRASLGIPPGVFSVFARTQQDAREILQARGRTDPHNSLNEVLRGMPKRR
mmetsp:Transcript_18597/g.27583  ORF Transcript_18597/g.27583 Transcript_18597/m.27583 type:complete len:524 (-) Transcript_18597:201-1772(-)